MSAIGGKADMTGTSHQEEAMAASTLHRGAVQMNVQVPPGSVRIAADQPAAFVARLFAVTGLSA
jgi:hypothetical protein